MFAQTRTSRPACPNMSASRLNATAYMRRQGFIEHEGFFFEKTHERDRACVVVRNDLNIRRATVDDVDAAIQWVATNGVRH